MTLAISPQRRPTRMTIITKVAALPLVVACVAALCVALSGIVPAANVAPAAAANVPQRALGTYDSSTTPPTKLKAALGGKLKYAMDFQSGTSWSTITASNWPYPQWKGTGYSMIWGIPMLPNSYSPNSERVRCGRELLRADTRG